MADVLIPQKSRFVSGVRALATSLLLWGAAQAHAQAPPPSLDSALTRQAYALGPHLERSEWADFSAELQFRQRPVWHGIGTGYVSLRGRLLRCPFNLDGGERSAFVRNHWLRFGGRHRWQPTAGLRQLNNNMDNLDLERRQSEYERLSMVLRERASKVRKLEAALPVLVFALNEEGKVVDVGVDHNRSKSGITRRSRGLILKALRDEKFRLPARQYTVTTKANNFRPAVRHALEEPRPLAEKLHRFGLGYRVRQLGHGIVWAATPIRLPVRALLYRKITLYGGCGATRTEWVPRFWGRY